MVTILDQFPVTGKDIIQSLTFSYILVEGNQIKRQEAVRKAAVEVSVRQQGLEDRLRNSAGVELMIPQCGQHTGRVHVLHIGIVSVSIAMHVC